jgi:hypothetical protein
MRSLTVGNALTARNASLQGSIKARRFEIAEPRKTAISNRRSLELIIPAWLYQKRKRQTE